MSATAVGILTIAMVNDAQRIVQTALTAPLQAADTVNNNPVYIFI